MKVYRKVNQNLLRLALETLEKEGLIIAPTDTVYGVLAPFTPKGAEKIFSFKKREVSKPLGVFVASCQEITRLAKVKKEVLPLIERLSSLPVTFILPKTIETPPGVGTEKTLGIRIARTPFLKKLLEMWGKPILQTSANLSGEKTVSTEKEVLELVQQASPQPDVVLLQGNMPVVPSTVIDLSGAKPKIIREGLMVDQVRKILQGYLGPKLS